MIPFASQRGLGQDLATHLMNEMDNEYMEVAQVRGAIAQDLHGAFAEWEAQAHGLTRCRNYLYSLSINPDPSQRALSRDEYLAYIDAAEAKLGLDGQPRAVVFHIKNGRAHCHVVWSRIDAFQGKAVHMAFDHDKLMMVTREFAQERGLTLPEGYYKEKERRGRQATLYEQAQQSLSGITQEERKDVVTQAWRRSDSAKAFVQALEERGYILATGRRPYVLVDLYGQVNALAKLIDDRQVRTKDVRTRLEKEFPPESLPSVEEAQALAAQHRQAGQDFARASLKAEELARLKDRQAERRRKIEADVAREQARRAGEREALRQRHRRERETVRDTYLAQVRRLRAEHSAQAPGGIPGFLSKYFGITRIREMMQRQRDKKLYDAFIAGKVDLRQRQEAEARTLDHRHHLQRCDTDRRLRALARIEERERKSLETKALAERRTKQRGRHEHIPAIRLDLKPKGRPAAPYKAKNRYISPHREAVKEAAREVVQPKKTPMLSEEFDRAAGEGKTEGKGSGGAAEPNPVSETKARRQRVRRQESDIDLAAEFRRAAEKDRSEDGAGKRGEDFSRGAGAEQTGDMRTADVSGPKPAPQEKASRKRHRKRRRDQGPDRDDFGNDAVRRTEVNSGQRSQGKASPSEESSRRLRNPDRPRRPRKSRSRDPDRER